MPHSILKRYEENLMPIPLQDGEVVLRKGVGTLHKGLFGGRWAPLVLTNRRLLWTATTRSILPFFANYFEVDLSSVRSVDRGNLLNFIFGGWCIRLHMKNRRIRAIYEGDGQLSGWIAAIRQVVALAQRDMQLERDPRWFIVASVMLPVIAVIAGFGGLLYFNGWIGVFFLLLGLVSGSLIGRYFPSLINPRRNDAKTG